MNILDIILIVVLLLGVLIGYRRGFIPSILSLVGTFAVIILSFWLKGPVGEFLYKNFPFMEFDGAFKGMSSLNIMLYESLAFILCYVILTIVLKVLIRVTKVVEKILSKIKLIAITSKVLGILVTVLEYGLLMFVIVLAMSLIPKTNPIVEKSLFGNKLLNDVPILNIVTKNIRNAQDEINNIANNKDIENKDEKALEVLYKYNLIDWDSIEELINNNKLDVKSEDIEKALEEMGVKND